MKFETEHMDDPECWCCPMMDICTKTEIDIVTKDMIKRSNCNGGFTDAFEDVQK